jgi:type 1 glutamine amidotransferase
MLLFYALHKKPKKVAYFAENYYCTEFYDPILSVTHTSKFEVRHIVIIDRRKLKIMVVRWPWIA